MYRADKTFEEIFESALEAMLRSGDLDEIADHIEVVNHETPTARETGTPPVSYTHLTLPTKA